jgi:hypothetical protein
VYSPSAKIPAPTALLKFKFEIEYNRANMHKVSENTKDVSTIATLYSWNAGERKAISVVRRITEFENFSESFTLSVASESL